MLVRNVHYRALSVPPADVAPLLDGLASPTDRLWPVEAWPRMRFDRPLQVGAQGGHGPIRYTVVEKANAREQLLGFLTGDSEGPARA